jgi:hypothetical protein
MPALPEIYIDFFPFFTPFLAWEKNPGYSFGTKYGYLMP